MVETKIPKLDAREEHFRIPSHHDGLSLFLRYLLPFRETEPRGNVVLYVHGGTFPSALSIAHLPGPTFVARVNRASPVEPASA